MDPKLLTTDAEPEQSEGNESEQEPNRWCSQDWEAVMGEEKRLAYDDPWSDSDTTAGGRYPRHPTPHEPGSPMEAAVEVHMRESEVEDL